MELKNQSFSNVVQTGVASTRVSLGQIINGLKIVMGGTSPDPTTEIGRVVVRINEKIVFDLSGAQIEVLQAHKGIVAAANELHIDFLEMTALTIGSMFTGAHDTSKGVSAYDLEVHTVGAPADVTLESYRDVSPAHPNSPGIGKIRAYVPQTLIFTASGKYSHMPSFHAEKKAAILRLAFLGSTVTAVGVKKRGVHVFDNIPLAVNANDLARWGRVTQSDLFCVDFVKRGIIEEALHADTQNIEYEVETSGAGDVTLITEMIISLGDL